MQRTLVAIFHGVSSLLRRQMHQPLMILTPFMSRWSSFPLLPVRRHYRVPSLLHLHHDASLTTFLPFTPNFSSIRFHPLPSIPLLLVNGKLIKQRNLLKFLRHSLNTSLIRVRHSQIEIHNEIRLDALVR